ncbi:MAG: glycosyltransferase family 4 protein [Comamonadaceae bacterium]|nr:glycosyltransferase family 4 protein [Comamonadaceae bacterium]
MKLGYADVAFVIDRVMHYHLDMLRAVETGLAAKGLALAVLSTRDSEGGVGRVATSEKAVRNHHHFPLTERTFGRFMLRYQHGLVAALRRIEPRVIVSTSHSGTLSEWAALRWARRSGVRTVAWQCGYEYNPGRIKRIALARFVPLFDFHLCYHTNARAYAIEHGAREDQTLVMHNTIDESRIVPMERAAARALLEQRHPQFAGRRIVLYVGAVLAEKRLEQILDALPLTGRDDLFFVLVGDGPHLASLKARYAMRQDWLAVGRVVDGVGVYFDAADVFVLPGTGGLAINEAMAHRLPVISGYADGSADDLVEDGQTGYRLRSGEPAALAALIDRALASVQESSRLGAAAEARIRGPLSFQAFTGRVIDTLVAQASLARR